MQAYLKFYLEKIGSVMVKALVGAIFHFCILTPSSGQQTFQNTFFYLDPYDLNPACFSAIEKIRIVARYRQQWMGIEGSPAFARINTHIPFPYTNNGFGLKISNERIGVQQDVMASLSYNHYFSTGFGVLSAGLRAGMGSRRIDGRKLQSATGIYDELPVNHNDDYLSEKNVAGTMNILSAGIYFFSDRFEIGTVFDYNPVVGKRIDNFIWKNLPLFTIHGKYSLPLVPEFGMEAFWMLKSDLVQWQNELGATVDWGNQFFAGLTVKGFSSLSPDVMSVAAGAGFGNFGTIAYSYEFGFSELNRMENGSHEILISWEVESFAGKRKKEPIIHNPRFYE